MIRLLLKLVLLTNGTFNEVNLLTSRTFNKVNLMTKGDS